jgi:hypothetical protein
MVTRTDVFVSIPLMAILVSLILWQLGYLTTGDLDYAFAIPTGLLI